MLLLLKKEQNYGINYMQHKKKKINPFLNNLLKLHYLMERKLMELQM